SVPPEPEHDALPRLGHAYRRDDAEAEGRPRRGLLLRLPDGLRPADAAGEKTRRPRASLDRAAPGGALLAALPGVRAGLPAGDGPGAADREDDEERLPDGVRRCGEGVRCVPASHRLPPRLPVR